VEVVGLRRKLVRLRLIAPIVEADSTVLVAANRSMTLSSIRVELRLRIHRG
jgi:hypothetical protein